MNDGRDSEILHATTVALAGRGVLIQGPSGSGKSALALQLMALGARLVADDRTVVRLRGGVPYASAPEATRGMIEARGLGLLNADCDAEARIHLAVDLGQEEDQRLPPRRSLRLLGHHVDLILGQNNAYFPAAIRQYVLAGRSD